jgi:superfamily II DNA helicase RecQ
LLQQSIPTSSTHRSAASATTIVLQPVVLCVSPLISLMRDQCVQLAAQGAVTSCFLGSGQRDVWWSLAFSLSPLSLRTK